MKPLIQIQNISKSFRINHERQGYSSLRDKIASAFSGKANSTEEFWALKDVSLDVLPGESLGIIGRNGAGKSTLLKILSKITPPTSGNILLYGKIASLLEVGTGFHPELTGRENVFLNGSILGMKKKEIEAKFDEIIDFAGTEKFLDTPLKHYSSGMQLRLAFAVAAFLEQDALIIDEVLAVGDSVFQQKCIQRMREISQSGRTLLFVSHNFASLRSLCEKAIVLKDGAKAFEGSCEDAIDFYNNNDLLKGREIDLLSVERKMAKLDLIFSKLQFEKEIIHFGEKIIFSLSLHSNVKKHFQELDFGVNFLDKNNVCLIHLSNRFIHKEIDHESDSSLYQFEVENNLKPGFYRLTLFLRSRDVVQDYLTDVVQFEIADGNPYSYSDTNSIQGVTLPGFNITVES